MQMLGRFGFVGLGIALAGCLTGAPVFAGEKPVAKPVRRRDEDHHYLSQGRGRGRRQL